MSAMNWMGPYVATSSYQSGDVVAFNGGTFIATVTVPVNTPPPAPTFWATLSPPSINLRGNWQSTIQYFQNDVVSYPENTQNLYIAKSAPPVGDAPTDSKFWAQLEKEKTIQDQGNNDAQIIAIAGASAAGVSALSSVLSTTAAIIAVIKSFVSPVQTIANAAQAAASAAQAAAGLAQGLAQAAQRTADDAARSASGAEEAARGAQRTADDAARTAEAASSTAQEASRAAQEASNIAQEAKSVASAAKNIAADGQSYTGYSNTELGNKINSLEKQLGNG